MTDRQKKMVEKLKAKAEISLFHGDGYEFKELKVKNLGPFVSVSIVVGLKGDEGSLAAILCRDRFHCFVGKRGGVTYPVNYQCKNGNWKHVERRWDGCTVLTMVNDQRA